MGPEPTAASDDRPPEEHPPGRSGVVPVGPGGDGASEPGRSSVVGSRLGDAVRRVRGPGQAEFDALAARVERLEAEVAEAGRLSLRVAELTDVVQELLVPVSVRDESRVREVLERYAAELGS